MTSTTSVSVNFKRHEMVILGTEYAGEMKKGVSLGSKKTDKRFQKANLFFRVDFYGHALLDAEGRNPVVTFICERRPGRRRFPLLWPIGYESRHVCSFRRAKLMHGL